MSSRPTFAWLAVLAGVILQTCCFPGVSQAANFDGIGISPGPTVAGRDPGSFHYDSQPGQVFQDTVTVLNTSSSPKAIRLSVSPGHVSPDNHFWCDQTADRQAWIYLQTVSVSLAANQKVQVPLKVQVPQEALPGEYASCIVASEERPRSSATTGAIKLSSRVAQRVTITIPGSIGIGFAISQPAITVGQYEIAVSGRLVNKTITTLSIGLAADKGDAKSASTTYIVMPEGTQSVRLPPLSRPMWGGWYTIRLAAHASPVSRVVRIRGGQTDQALTFHVFLWPTPKAAGNIVAAAAILLGLGTVWKLTRRRKSYRLHGR